MPQKQYHEPQKQYREPQKQYHAVPCAAEAVPCSTAPHLLQDARDEHVVGPLRRRRALDLRLQLQRELLADLQHIEGRDALA